MKRISVCIPALALLSAAATPAQTPSLADVFTRVKDSVVVVRTIQKEELPWGGPEKLSVPGLGSGVLISPDHVLTASHVIQTALQIQVELPGGEKINAKTLASAAYADVALLKLERVPSKPSFAKLGDSDRVRVGEEIFIVGAPLGISHTLTVGHISARREADSLPGMFLKAELLQTDAAINQGNSGGPMFNLAGEVIGVVSSMLSRSGGYEGLGFVITSNLARRLVVDARTPWSGFEGFLLEGELAKAFNLPQAEGVLVQRVAEGSPAERAGLIPGSLDAVIEGRPVRLGGDVILGVNGIGLSEKDGFERIQKMLTTLAPGEKIRVGILREGKRIDLEVVPVVP
jgi:S1-C subfamily serine protease